MSELQFATAGGEIYRNCYRCSNCSKIWHYKSLLRKSGTQQVFCPDCVSSALRGQQERSRRPSQRRPQPHQHFHIHK